MLLALVQKGVGSKDVLKAMMQEHFVDRDILLVSKKGQGKTVTAMEFASILGYMTQVFGLYKDMTSRDLLMHRTTDSIKGETSWEASPLLKAAVNGDICILDGVDKLGKDTLSTLQSLVHNRELSLPNGQRLVRADRFDKANHSYPNFAYDSVLSHQQGGSILPVHDAFRIIALGSVTENGAGWLTENAMSMFSTIPLPPPSHQCLKAILKASSRLCPENKLNKLLDFHNRLTEPAASDCAVPPLSTRNLVRIVKQIQPSVSVDSNLYEVILSVLMGSLLPPTQKQSLDHLLNQAGIVSNSSADSQNEKIDVEQDTLKIGTCLA
jgi:MoxR-like ATPase